MRIEDDDIENITAHELIRYEKQRTVKSRVVWLLYYVSIVLAMTLILIYSYK